MPRMTITIDAETKASLIALAELESKDSRKLAGAIIKQELEKRLPIVTEELIKRALCGFAGRPVGEFLDVVEKVIINVTGKMPSGKVKNEGS